ncbi:hypothetical protein POJ06DRAFT_286940 [Lipomyces tetrasporus]|uniref:Uncharacterized protein n=1 Tax=Lipomyces tetrasporus TaxID=54092 RepID=A0AAD7QK26_9ASCO|nr:uncharacterized protein POJ06DRAFT_286940 [Lipomyces tetrasporus]KAJ8096664.1 hypothetical protein POJ06DRAFT_286940 [Lipomyces tetrasporus]
MEPEESLARYRVIRFENITNTANLTLAKRGNPTYGWRVDYWDIANRCTTKPSGYYNDDNNATSTRPWASTSMRSGRWPATCHTSPPSPPSWGSTPRCRACTCARRRDAVQHPDDAFHLKGSLATLIARLVVKSQLQENIKNNRRLTYTATQHSFSPPMSPPLSPPLPQYAMLATPPVSPLYTASLDGSARHERAQEGQQRHSMKCANSSSIGGVVAQLPEIDSQPLVSELDAAPKPRSNMARKARVLRGPGGPYQSPPDTT